VLQPDSAVLHRIASLAFARCSEYTAQDRLPDLVPASYLEGSSPSAAARRRRRRRRRAARLTAALWLSRAESATRCCTRERCGTRAHGPQKAPRDVPLLSPLRWLQMSRDCARLGVRHYLPISPDISAHLRTSPHISPGLGVRHILVLFLQSAAYVDHAGGRH